MARSDTLRPGRVPRIVGSNRLRVMSAIGTERSTSAVQRFGPELEGQLTLGGCDREDR
jgi:hypothetical protein